MYLGIEKSLAAETISYKVKFTNIANMNHRKKWYERHMSYIGFRRTTTQRYLPFCFSQPILYTMTSLNSFLFLFSSHRIDPFEKFIAN